MGEVNLCAPDHFVETVWSPDQGGLFYLPGFNSSFVPDLAEFTELVFYNF